jgi:HK97 family phage prohead protease
MDKINKIFNFEIKQMGEESDRTLRFVGSDETPDRDNDIMEVNGWKLDEYLKNPVFLWAHDYDKPPVGKAISVIIDAATKKLLFDIKFATAEEYPFADTIYKLYKGGYLNATSVGFRGTKFETRNDESVINMPEWQRGRRYKEQNLLELSAVPVPSNPNALMQAKSAGIETDIIEKAVKNAELEIDNEHQTVKIHKENGDTKEVTFDFLKSLNDESIKFYGDWKSGATLSTKTKAMLDEIHVGLAGCGDRLRKFIDTAGIIEDESLSMAEPIMTAIRTAEITEMKQALEEIKSQVLFLYEKSQPVIIDAPKEINLDAIDAKTLLPTETELKIEPDMLKKLISESIENTVKASVQEHIKNLKTGGINL